MATKRYHRSPVTHKQAVNKTQAQFDTYLDTHVRQTILDEVSNKGKIKMDKEQTDAAIETWINKNPGKYTELRQKYTDGLALIRYTDIQDFQANAQSSAIIMNNRTLYKKAKTAEPINVKETYERIGSSFFDYVRQVADAGTQKVQSGSDLIRNTINLDNTLLYQSTRKGVTIPADRLKSAYDAINQAGRFMVFDIETLSGIDKTGQTALDHITEFSFGVADLQTGRLGDTYGSIIGISSAKANELENIIKDIEQKGFVTNRHKVIAERLAKIGHSKTKWRQVAGKSAGIFEYIDFAGDKDISPTDTKSMRNAVDQLLKIGKIQEANKVTFEGQGMFAWEQEMLTALDEIKKGMVVAGHNIGAFDHPLLSRFTAGRLSEGAASVAKAKGLTTLDWDGKQFDVLAALRSSAMADNWQDFYTAHERSTILKAHDLTHFQQEALVRKFMPDFYKNRVAHVGRTDVEALAGLMAKSTKMPGKDISFLDYTAGNIKDSAIKTKLRGGRQQLFYAKESIGLGFSDKEGIMSFVQDAFTGQARTFGGYTFSPDGKAVKEPFGQWGFQRGVSYSLDHIGGLEMEDEWIKTIQETHPALARKDLVVAKWSAETGADTLKAQSPIYMIGTPESIQREIGQKMLFTHEVSADGKFADLADETARKEVAAQMRSYRYSPTKGPGAGAEGFRPHTLEEQLAEGTFRLRNEASARARRELNIEKEKGLLHLFADMDAEAARRGLSLTDDVRKQLHKELLEDSVAMARGVTTKNLKEPGDRILKTYQHYFGKQDKSGVHRLYRETLDAARSSETYSRSVRDIMDTLVQAAEERGGKNINAQNFYLHRYFEALQDHAIDQGLNLDEIANNENFFVRQMDLNKFDIDMSRYVKNQAIAEPTLYDNLSHIFSLNLDQSNLGLADKLRERRGAREAFGDTERIAEIRRFAQYLGDENIIDYEAGFKDFDTASETLDTATNRIITSLKTARQDSFSVGRLKGYQRQNVLTESNLSALGLTPETTKELINRADSSTFRPIFTSGPGEARLAAEQVVDNVLFNHVSHEQLAKFGYSDRQITDLLNMREMRRQDTIGLVEELVKSMPSKDSALFYDVDTNAVGLFADGKQTILHNLPRDIFRDGRFYTKIGNRKIVAPIGLYTSRKNKTLQMQSLIGKAYGDTFGYNVAPYLEDAAREGNLTGYVSYLLGKFGKTMGEAPGVYDGSLQDIRANFYVDISNMIPALKDLNRQGYFNDIVFENHDEFLRILNKDLDVNRLSYYEQVMLLKNEDKLLQGIMQHGIKDETSRDFLSRITADNKEIAGYMRTVDNLPDFGEQYGSIKRGIHQQVSRAIMFDAEKAQQSIDSIDSLKGMTIGKGIYSREVYGLSHRTLTGTTAPSDMHLGINRMSISNVDLRSIINKAIQDGDITNEKMAGVLTNIHLMEGGAVANPEIIHEFYNQRQSIQKIPLHKLAEHSKETVEQEMRKRSELAPRIIFHDDGSIGFQYKNGMFVHKGDKLVSISGYGGEPTLVRGNHAGMLRFGAFADGRIVSQEDVTSTLNLHKNRIMSAVDREAETYRVLESIYDLNIYNAPFAANMHRKTAYALEKNMTNFLSFGLGDGDEKVARAFRGLGLGNYLGVVPQREYIDALTSENIADTALGAIIRKETGKALSHEDIVSRIGRHYASPAEMQKAVLDEQFSPWRTLRMALEKTGVVNPDETIHAITNNLEGELKHKDPAGVILRTVEQLRHSAGYTPEEVHAIMKEAVVGLEEDGVLFGTYGSKVDVKKIERIIESHGLSTIREANGYRTEISRDVLSEMKNWDGGSAKGMKVTRRSLLMFEWNRYDIDELKELAGGMDKETFDQAFGHVVNYVDGDMVLRDKYKNRAITRSIGDQLRREMFLRPGETPAMLGGQIIETGEVAERISQLRGRGVDLSISERALRRAGVQEASLDVLEDIYAAAAGVKAQSWNAGNMSMRNIDELRKMGFEDTSLGELGMEKGEKGYLIGQSYLVDLHDPIFGAQQLYDKPQDRFLALPFATERELQGEEIANEMQAEVRSLMHDHRRYHTDIGVGGKGLTEEQRIRSVAGMREKITQIKKINKQNVSGKNKLLANLGAVRLPHSERLTASGLMLYGQEQSPYHQALEFDGKSLVGQAQKGIEYDFTIVGRKHFADQGYFDSDLLEMLGMTPGEMEKELRTKGTLAFNYREPTDYIKSMSMSALYLGETGGDDRVIIAQAMADSKKADYDSDQINVAIQKTRAYIRGADGKETIRDIDELTYRMMKERKINVRLDDPDVFTDAKSSMHYYAHGYNKHYSMLGKIEEAIPEKMPGGSLDTIAARHYAIADELHPRYKDILNKEESRRHIDRFEELTGRIMERTGLQRHELILDPRAYSDAAVNIAGKDSGLIESFAYGMSKQMEELDSISKVRKASAGEANYYLYQYKELINAMRDTEGINISNRDANAAQKVALAIQESFLTGKHETLDDALTLEDYKVAHNAMLGIGGKRDGSLMLKYLQERVPADRSEFKKLPRGMSVEEAQRAYVNIGLMAEATPETQNIFGLGILKDGVSSLHYTGKDINPVDHAVRAVSYAIEEAGATSPITQADAVRSSRQRVFADDTLLRSAWKAPTDLTTTESVQGLLSSATDTMSRMNLTGRHLAFGALGLAGAAMIAGFVGGNPSAPPTMQAANMQSEDMYGIPNMMDQNLAIQANPRSGYIININAQTEKGQQHAIDAINQAIAMSQNTNVNVQMNVRTSNNITDSKMRSRIEGVFQ